MNNILAQLFMAKISKNFYDASSDRHALYIRKHSLNLFLRIKLDAIC